jgi:hypothetical protein
MKFKNKRTKKKKVALHVLCVVSGSLVAVIIVCLALLTHRPGQYQPQRQTKSEAVNPYLTHYLAPQVNNNIQIDKPFEVIVPQKELNEIIADEGSLGWSWPVKLNGVTFDKPIVIFAPNRILLMGTVDYAGFPIVVTVIGDPALDESGLLSLNLRKVKAGILNITPLAKFIAGKVFAHQIKKYDTQLWLVSLCDALLANKPFEPVFPTYDNKDILLTGAEIEHQQLTLRFRPAKSAGDKSTRNTP